MSRRHSAEKREINPDPKFGDIVVSKFMNSIMQDGKKSVAERIVYNALDRVQAKLKREPVEVFHEALDNVKPSVEVRSRRVGGATYQVPVEVRTERRQAHFDAEPDALLNGPGQPVRLLQGADELGRVVEHQLFRQTLERPPLRRHAIEHRGVSGPRFSRRGPR